MEDEPKRKRGKTRGLLQSAAVGGPENFDLNFTAKSEIRGQADGPISPDYEIGAGDAQTPISFLRHLTVNKHYHPIPDPFHTL